VLVASLLATSCGLVPNPEQEAKRRATDHVRAAATGYGTNLWAGLRAVDASGARQVLEQQEALLGRFDAEGEEWRDGVLAAAADTDGTVRLDLAFRDRADAGGGLSAAQTVVMLCVRLTGTPGPSGQVRLTNLACPAGSVITYPCPRRQPRHAVMEGGSPSDVSGAQRGGGGRS